LILDFLYLTKSCLIEMGSFFMLGHIIENGL